MESRARWLLNMVRSGDEGLPCVGRRVGWSSLRRTIWLESMASTIVNHPLAAARSSCVAENHALLWALKSPHNDDVVVLLLEEVGEVRCVGGWAR